MAEWLSRSYDLTEFISSPTAKAHAIDNTPPVAAVQALRRLCVNVLQPLRDHFQREVHIASGYRCPALNAEVSRNPQSQHTLGEAADIWINLATTNEIMLWLSTSGLPFDQAVLETSRGVVHLSHTDRRPNRGQLLHEIGRSSRYEPWPCP